MFDDFLVSKLKERLTPDQQRACGLISTRDVAAEQASVMKLSRRGLELFEDVESLGSDNLGEEESNDGGPFGDSDFVILFERMTDAIAVRDAAYELGLVPGEVSFNASSMIDGTGKFALSFAPHVVISKNEILEALLGMIRDGFDMEARESIDEYLMTPQLVERGNPYHGAPNPNAPKGSAEHRGGQFVSKEKLQNDKKGSYSWPGKKKRKVRTYSKGLGLQWEFTKPQCGRPGRRAGRDVLCYTGKEVRRSQLQQLAKAKREEFEAIDSHRKLSEAEPGTVGAMFADLF